MRASQLRALTDTLTVTDTVSVVYRHASYSYSFALLPDAYQGEAKSEKTYLPCAPGVLIHDGAGFGKRVCV